MTTVLVANRGEVAVRIIRTCKELGLRTVAVYSDADSSALHVRLADDAHRIGPAPVRESYLDVEALVSAAKASGADAVHPGYGMLSENASFARAVVGAGLEFVGPSADVIAMMGDKVAARGVASECGVPVPRGTADLDPADTDAVAAAADTVGYPLVVKASFGGGGRGMRIVDSPASLADAIASAGREAAAAFGRSEVHLERYLQRPRHVEVQVIGDAHGNVLHLGDRDCSVQRRHQKLIEEAPAFGLGETLPSALTDAALRICRQVGYVGAGTVEFLVLPATEEFFFLEMNTRLQVEHGVTELVTGIDIVAAQLHVADGHPLPWRQDDIRVRGHAIQARIAAEDPWEGFRPTPGRITKLDLPSGPGLRNDFGVTAGDTVAPEYDSMFGKVLASGADRESARRRLATALEELAVDGVPTTAPYLRSVLGSSSFVAGTHDTESVAREWTPDPGRRPAATPPAPPGAPASSGTPARRVRIQTDRGQVVVAIYGHPGPAPATLVPSLRPTREGAPTGSVATGPGATGGPPVSPMNATVVKVPVSAGQDVVAGDVVAVLEAMKMEMEIRTEIAGTVAEVHAVPGLPIAAGQPLVTFA